MLASAAAQRIGSLLLDDALESPAPRERTRSLLAFLFAIFVVFSLHASLGTGSLSTPVIRAEGPLQSLHGDSEMQFKSKFVAMASAVALSVGGSALAADAVQWRVEDGGNGHWYQMRNTPMTWTAAREQSLLAGGDLATISNAAENAMVHSIGGTTYCFLGGFQAPGSCEPACGWQWVDGGNWTYTNWAPAEPNDQGGERYLEMYATGGWNDVQRVQIRPFIIEYSADCNNDSIVDYGQILDGSFADANSNGELDVCETLLVPEGYAHFGATTDSIRILGNTTSATTAFTREMRIRVAPGSELGHVLSEQRDAVEAKITLIGALEFYQSDVRGYVCGSETTSPLDATFAGGWHHVAHVRDGSTARLFIDGVLRQEQTGLTTCTADSSDSAMAIGRFVYGTPCCFGLPLPSFLGDLDWIRVSDVARYSMNFTPPMESTITADASTELLLKFNEPAGTATLIDESDHQFVCDVGVSMWSGMTVTAPTLGNRTPVQWPVSAGGNGHWYLGISESNSWIAAREKTRAVGGDLASVETAAENAFIVQAILSPYGELFASGGGWGPHIGGVQSPRSEEPLGGWTWLTGVAVDCSAGLCEMENCCGGQDRLAYARSGAGFAFNDVAATSTIDTPSYLIEWSADCNNDGLVDYGQILNGQLADSDANGVPDACEGLQVPSQYSTIQAAINAVSASTSRIVQVAAGTYNESFSLNGKDVTVRGAPNNATILDGTGLTTSIARFTGGEPATASLENLVFRNGTSGSLLNPKGQVRLGGAIMARDAFVTLLNCRFESCRADFGGAAYLYYTTLNAQGCTFTNNNSNDDGGALMCFRTNGEVSASSFTGNRCGIQSTSSGSAIKVVGGRTAYSTFTMEGCTITGAPTNNFGSAVQQYEDELGVPGVLRLVGTTVTGNTTSDSASGLRVSGGMQSCILSGNTTICNNTPVNVEGPYAIDGNATVCDCNADLNGDGRIDAIDISTLLGNWGLTLPSGDGDANHDGVVNAVDLAIVLDGWGLCN